MTEVSEDNSLSPAEKQVSLVAEKESGQFRVHSDVASVTRWLLRHPAFEVERTRTQDGSVVSCTGTFPIGGVTLKGKPRKSNQFGRMLSSATLRDKDADP